MKKGRCSDGFSCRTVLHDSDGMALVVTLMVLALMTALVVEFSYGVFVNTSALHNWTAMQRLSIAAETGVRVASLGITFSNKQHSYTYPGVVEKSGLKPFDDFDGEVSLRVEDESGKFNINKIVGNKDDYYYAAFVRLLKFLEIDPSIADRVTDWIDPDSEPRIAGSEDGAKNGLFESVDELLLVKGLSRSDYDKLAPYVTIYGDGMININSAQAPVLVALSDSMDRDLADRIITRRDLSPFKSNSDIVGVPGFETLGQSLQGRITVKGSFFRVRSTAALGSLKRIIESVLQVSGNNTVIRYWLEI